MEGLLILTHLRNISDESVVEQYSENVYYQYLCGQSEFVSKVACEASELVDFQNLIGEAGVELILKESIRINGDYRFDPDVSIDTTVQEKNITFPTDNKLHRKIITKCKAISEKEDLPVRQSYSLTLKKLSMRLSHILCKWTSSFWLFFYCHFISPILSFFVRVFSSQKEIWVFMG